MSRLTRFLLLGLALVLLLAPALAIAGDPLMPDRPPGSQTYDGEPPLYESEQFSPYAYTIDGEGLVNKVGYQSIYFWINVLMVSKAWLLRLAIRMAEYALSIDFLAPFLDNATSALEGLRASLWDGASPMVAGALALTGLWAMVLYMRGRVSRTWAALGGSILIVMATALLLTQGPGWASKANAFSREFSREVYDVADGVGADPAGWGLVARSGDALWQTLVYEPWLAAEFGAESGADKFGQLDADSFLLPAHQSLDYRWGKCSSVRDSVVAELTEDCPLWADEHMAHRMLLAGWTFLATVAISGTVAVLSGGIILAQLALLFLLALAPVWLLIALWWPEHGQRLLSALWMRALGALVMQAVLAATLGVLLLLSVTVTSVFDGWMLQSLLLTALGLVAFRYRIAWPQPLATATHRAGEASAWLRGGAGRTAASRHAVTGVEGQSAPVPAAPAFANLATPDGRAESQSPPPEREREDFPAGAAAPQHMRVASSGAAPNLALFRSEMQLLSEQFMVGEQITLREQIAQSGLAPGELAWHPTPPAGPDPGTGVIASQASRRTGAAPDRGRDLDRIPTQRPRG